MYSSDGRLSLQSLSEFESSRSWTTDNILGPTPPPPPPQEEETSNPQYMGICLPRKLTMIFPDQPRVPPPILSDDYGKPSDVDPKNLDEDFASESDVNGEHSRLCLVCYQGKNSGSDNEPVDEADAKLRRQVSSFF